MKTRILTIALALLAGPALAQWPSTAANQTLKAMFTIGNGNFGFPPYAADPFACNATTRRTTYYNTTSDSALLCNGTAWVSVGSSSGITLGPDGSAANPAYSFKNFPSTGMYVSSGPVLSFAVSGALRMYITGGGDTRVQSAAGFSIAPGGANATILTTDAAHAFAQRSGTSAQTFRIYNTFTDASNYERGSVNWASNVFNIATEAAGTGTLRNIRMTGGASLTFAVAAADQWTITASQLTPQSDIADDIGQTSVKVRDFFVGRSTQGSLSKSLTSGAAAVAVVRVSAATNGYAGGHLLWNATETNGTDYQSLMGGVYFSVANKGAAMTCAIGVIGTNLTAASAGTLACTWTSVAAANGCDLSATCTTSLATPGAIAMNYRLNMPLTNTVAAQ